MRETFHIFAFDLVVLAVCALGVYRVSEKAGLPATYAAEKVIAIDGMAIPSAGEREFLLDEHSIGETAQIVLDRDGKLIPVSTVLVRDYSRSKILVECFAAFIFFVTGIIVLVLQSRDRAARIFHHLAISIAALILLTTGRFAIAPRGLGYALEILFQSAYVLVPALFVHFTLIFPSDRFQAKKKILAFVYSIAAGIALWSGIAFLRVAYLAIRLDRYDAYATANYGILIFFAILFIIGFVNLLHSYRHAQGEFERRKLRWIFFGIVCGTSAYLVFSLVSKIVTGTSVDEQYTIALSALAPISFAIAIIRFKVFDIDLFFKRSTVYALAISALLVLYLGVVALLMQVVLAMNLPVILPNIIGAILGASLFEPMRKRIQQLVDKKFFRVSYNFHEAQRSFIEKIKFATTQQSLAALVVESIDGLIPATKIGFFAVENPSDRLRLLAHRNFDLLERHNVQLRTGDLKTGLELPVALPAAVEPGIGFEPADKTVFERWGMALVIPMLSANRTILGFLVLGEKRSGERFLLEDISLLTSVAAQTALALERIRIERELTIEHAESDRLAELSAMKSFFVSSVSHDLKTPLTSIRLFAELMKDHADLPREKVLGYLNIIEGESVRLARLIANVLDFANIERGTKEYARRPQDLSGIARDVIRSMEYQIHSHGFAVHTTIASEPLAQQTDTIAIVHFNDTHSSLAPFGPRTASLAGTRGGIARAATVIENAKATEKNLLVLHAGDFSAGDIFYNVYFGAPELKIYAALGLDAMTVGNHEWDLTPANLQMVLDSAFASGGQFPLLSANTILADSSLAGLRKYIQPYTIKTVGHTKVGIFGMTTPSTNELSMPAPAIIDTNLVGDAQAAIDTLRAQQCQVILMLSHLGFQDDSIVTANTTGLTMVVGGHDHYLFPKPREVVNPLGDTVPIVQAGAHFMYMGTFHLAVTGTNVRLLDYTIVPLDSAVQEDPAIKATVDTLIAGIEALYGPMYSQKLTDADDDFIEVADSLLDAGKHDTPVGNLVTDAFRNRTGTDIAIEVGGSTSDELYKGPIVGADVFRMIGYGFNTDNGLDYRIATFTLTGSEIIAGLEFGLSAIDQNDEFLIQCSGLNYTYDPTQPAYSRVISATVGGLPIDTGKTYTVTGNEFAAAFLPLIGLDPLNVIIHSDTTEYQVVSSYISNQDAIYPLVQGRVLAELTVSSVSTVPVSRNSMSVYPNPASNYVTIQFAIQNPSQVEIVVFSSDGVEVAHFADALPSGTFSSILDTSSLPNGTYFCLIKAGNRAMSTSFVVTK